ncbi:MAG: M1 family aminopeptidase [Acidobacteriaceae bacterium]
MKALSRWNLLRSGGVCTDACRGWLTFTILIAMVLLAACRPAAQQTVKPSAAFITPFTTSENPLASPAPVEQQAALLPGFPAIPAELTHYSIRVEINYNERTFTVAEGVEYTNRTGVALDSLYFRLYPNLGQSYGNGMIYLDSTQVNGQAAETKMSLFNSIVQVELPEPLQPGGHARVDFKTKGQVPHDFGGGDLGTGYGMYNYSQGVLALANFYPMLAVYTAGEWRLDPVYAFGDSVFSQAALYTVDVLTDPGLVVVSSGLEVSQESVGTKTLRHYISGPAREFTLVVSPEFQVVSRQEGSTQVNSYYLPGDDQGGHQALETASRALEIFNAKFGPYPYKEYDVVEAPLNQASGIEYPGMALVAERLYDDTQDPAFDTTVAHEVAHQWWYNVVGNDVIREPWLDEALATYSSIYYWEQVGRETAYQQALAYYQERYNQTLQAGMDAPVTAPMAYFQAGERSNSYGAVVYAKGALFFDALDRLIGDQAFFTALQFYYGSHWFSIASSTDLISAVHSATEISLDQIIQQWLYSPEREFPEATHTPTPTATQTPEPSPTPTMTITPTPTSTPEPPLVFAAIGDYGGADSGIEAVAELIKSWQPEFIITLGDNNYPVGAREHIDLAIGQYFHDYIFPYLGNFGSGADRNRFFPVIGNHDMQSESGKPYYDYFTLPGNERYYDFVWGPVHLYALDSLDSEPDGVGASSVQARWLKEQLQESTSKWNIVYMHYPPYSSGLHGSTDWMRWPFDEWGVDAVLAGHDHIYERLQVDGVSYFVNGMGGYDLYEFRDILDGSQMRYMDDYGAMRIVATSEYLSFEFINLANELVDSYAMAK